MSLPVPIVLTLLAAFALSVLGLLWQSGVRDRYLRDPSLPGAKAVHRVRAIGLLARAGFIVATAGLFVVVAQMLGFGHQYGTGVFVPVAIVGCVVAYGVTLAYFFRCNVAYLKAFGDKVPPPNSGRAMPYIVGLRRPGPLMNRVYVLYITEPMLCAAVASGMTLFANRPGNRDADPDLWIDASMEVLYDRIDVTGPIFLALHAGNLQLAWRDIARIDCDKRTRRWRRWFTNSGRITIQPKNGRPLDFILVGDADGEQIKADLEGVVAAGTAKDLLANNPASGTDSR